MVNDWDSYTTVSDSCKWCRARTECAVTAAGDTYFHTLGEAAERVGSDAWAAATVAAFAMRTDTCM